MTHGDITVVIPVSPIPSHPDTSILDETIDSIRHHLPDPEIILTFDGVRAEQEHRRRDYEQHVRRALWKADHDTMWRPVCPYVFDEHLHQVGMLRAVIEDICTPLLMYVEHDMPILKRSIDFDAVIRFLRDDRSDLVRFYLRHITPEGHEYLMHDLEDDMFLRTAQWSQNVHIATVEFYKRILRDYFTPQAKSYIEDGVYGQAENTYPSNKFRLHIYHPAGDIKYLQHLDGRGADPKYEEDQVY